MGFDVSVVVRYRKAVTYGMHALLAALEAAPPAVDFEIRFATSAEETAIQIGQADAGRVLVLWSFYSPDFPLMTAELAEVRALTDRGDVVHVAGGVHATAEPQQVIDAGWDVAAIGEGETTIIALVAEPDLRKVPGLAVRDHDGIALRTPGAPQLPLDAFPSFPTGRAGPIEITRGCRYTCKFCQTPFMFGAQFRHRSVESVRDHVRRMAARGLRDVRFITPTSLSYGSQGADPDLGKVEELLVACKEEAPAGGRVFFGSFPSEIRPEHVTPEAMRMLRKYVANDNIIIGAQSGSDRILASSGRGHGAAPVLDAARIAIDFGFRPNVDFIFGMPGETEDDQRDSLRLASDLADLGARIHTHTFMPLPGTPWRDAEPALIPLTTTAELDRLAQRGDAYGHWRKQAEHAQVLAETAKQYPRRTPRRRI
ncbi:TIGR04013 family B12-binding domain/radical SAM domain-containing protein [Herbidospora sp. RD11066]